MSKTWKGLGCGTTLTNMAPAHSILSCFLLLHQNHALGNPIILYFNVMGGWIQPAFSIPLSTTTIIPQDLYMRVQCFSTHYCGWSEGTSSSFFTRGKADWIQSVSTINKKYNFAPNPETMYLSSIPKVYYRSSHYLFCFLILEVQSSFSSYIHRKLIQLWRAPTKENNPGLWHAIPWPHWRRPGFRKFCWEWVAVKCFGL